jgi:exportin-2 (importin alpha re-exporter)
LTDLTVNIGVLQTAHSIFKRWRHEFRSDELFSEMKYVIGEFAASFLAFFKAIDLQVDQANAGNIQVLMETVLLLSKIFYDLNCQDLPEFFEDNQNEFMNIFHKYLVYTNPLIPSVSYSNPGRGRSGGAGETQECNL